MRPTAGSPSRGGPRSCASVAPRASPHPSSASSRERSGPSPRAKRPTSAILYASLALEHEAIWLYDHGLKRKLFSPGLRAYAVEFRGDHEGHRDTQIAIAEERGGRPPGPLPSYDFGRLESGDDLVRQAHVIERAAQDAYLALISQIRTKDYLLSAGFILVDEVRHLTVWRRVLGLRVW